MDGCDRPGNAAKRIEATTTSPVLGNSKITFRIARHLLCALGNFRRVLLVKSALDVYTGPVLPNSLWHDERAVRDKFRIHYADLDPAVGSTRLFAVARNARVGFAKTLGAHDCRRNSGLSQEVADSFGATL